MPAPFKSPMLFVIALKPVQLSPALRAFSLSMIATADSPLLVAIAVIGACALMAHADTKLGPYAPVTDARLAKPEPQNWLMYRGNYNGWGYSALDKINAGNVKKLKLAWSSATGSTEGHQSPPIVNNGYMYVTTPNAQVMGRVRDPLDHMVYEVHQYFDKDGSGTSTDCVSPEIGAERLKRFTAWLREHKRRALLGELDGIAQQVEQDLLQAQRIAHHPVGRAGIDIGRERDALGGGLRRQRLGRALDQLDGRQFDVLEFELAGLDLEFHLAAVLAHRDGAHVVGRQRELVVPVEGRRLGVGRVLEPQPHAVDDPLLTGVGDVDGRGDQSRRADERDRLAQTTVDVAERVARDVPGLVATVGEIAVAPGAANVIPGAVVHTLDVRHARDRARRSAVRRLRAAASVIARRRGLRVAWVGTQDNSAVPCDPLLAAALARSVGAVQDRVPRLVSGAGHDAVVLSALTPVAMLFVRCRGGLSHHPREHVSTADLRCALRALVDFLEGFRP